jgi:hypothetical protein
MKNLKDVVLPYPQDTNFVTLYSGGKGSFLTACLLKAKQYKQTFYFNDTFYEHSSLYVFLDQSLAFLHDRKPLNNYVSIPSLRDWKERRLFLQERGQELADYYEDFVYDAHEESLHEVIESEKFMPNSRIDLCSRILKRERSAKFIKKFNPEDIKVAIGIGLWEEHRVSRAKEFWLPYEIVSPFCDSGEFESKYKDEIFNMANLVEPHLYQIGLAHNNCAGFCVKAGIKHYRLLLEKDRDLYLTHEDNEQKLYKNNPNLRPFLNKMIKGEKLYITLKQLRENIELSIPFVSKDEIVDDLDEDFGLCNCAI